MAGVQENEERDRSPPPVRRPPLWERDEFFASERVLYDVPKDPHEWTTFHVRLWIHWATGVFTETLIDYSQWTITGAMLYEITLADFKRMIPVDPSDMFWTHFEILRKTHMAVVVCDPKKRMKPRAVRNLAPAAGRVVRVVPSSDTEIQLWQFLLRLLTTREHIEIIAWQDIEGEFKFVKSEEVAKLWGALKHRPAMNYYSMSRLLRHYYDKSFLEKVRGKPFVYKFVCDLRKIIGYTSLEMRNLMLYSNPNPQPQVDNLSELLD